MLIKIVNAETGAIIFQYPITARFAGESTSEEEAKNQAWLSALEDKLVASEDRSKYLFVASDN